MPNNTEWELICDKVTERLPVPGGWIVRTFQDLVDISISSMVFISDPDHLWLKEEATNAD